MLKPLGTQEPKIIKTDEVQSASEGESSSRILASPHIKTPLGPSQRVTGTRPASGLATQIEALQRGSKVSSSRTMTNLELVDRLLETGGPIPRPKESGYHVNEMFGPWDALKTVYDALRFLEHEALRAPLKEALVRS